MLFLRQNLLRIFRFPVKKRIFRGRLTGIAYTCVHPSSQSSCCAASPAENITRVSTLLSAATEQAEPIAIPTSTLLIAHGTPSSLLHKLRNHNARSSSHADGRAYQSVPHTQLPEYYQHRARKT